MAVGLLEADAPLVDEHLDVRVVLGDLGELALAQLVRPRVADVHHAQLRAGEQHGRQRGTHAFQGRVGVDGVADLLVRRLDGSPQGVDHRAARYVLVQWRHRRDHDVARHVAGGHAAHPVGHGE